jgi:uncharacterized protein (TIGR02421 family)
MSIPDSERERIRRLAGLLRRAEQPIRILRTVAWPPSLRERFFAAGADRLPEPEYSPPDPSDTLAALAEVRRELRPEGSVDEWLRRQADAVESAARMLAAVGKPEFLEHSLALYGGPQAPLPDSTTALQLAVELDQVLLATRDVDLGAPAPACHLAAGVAEQMRAAVAAAFGESAPEVVVVDELSANALAGPRAIRIRRTASFTDRDVAQLIHHEAYVHVGTSLNGRLQADLPILAAGHAGTTRTQEGLAVLAEFVSGTMDTDRLGRLAGRVRAIQMATEGADFLEVYRFFLGRGLEEGQAFESSRRVFRGGVIAGGAPFTKDVVYLDGLLRVHNFLRAAVSAGRPDCIRLLFCGKLDLADVPALAQLSVAGMCRAPRFLPPWVSDLRFLLAHLAYSAFLNRVDLSRIREHYRRVLSETPRVHLPGAG